MGLDRIQRFVDVLVASGVEGSRLLDDDLLTFEPRDGYVFKADRRARIPLLNGMTVVGPTEPDAVEMRRVRDELAAEELPFGVQLIEGRTSASERAIHEIGLEEIEVGHVMDLAPGGLLQPASAEVTVRTCTSDEDLRTMVSFLAEAFEADEPSFAPLLRLLEPQIREVFTTMLACEPDGEPVATAAVFVSGGGAMIANVATRPAWRRRGIGTAVTAAAVRAGFDGGAAFAWLIASPDGVSPYRTIGFEPVCTIHLYAVP